MSAPEHLQALGRVSVLADADSVAAAALHWLVDACDAAVAQRGSFDVALAGGGTPRLLYAMLARPPWQERVPWEAWRVWFGDERAVPPDDASSNYRMAQETLLQQVPVNPERVQRMRGEAADLDAAAAEYHALMARTLTPAASGVPQLDCVLLGLGENGHTASLFPGTEALEVRDRWAARGRADYAPHDRLTLTFPALNAAAAVAFLVTGESKRAALRQTAAGTTPAARVQPEAAPALWFVDREAAAAEPAPGR